MYTFPAHTGARDEDRLQFGAHVPHNMPYSYDRAWTPIDPALCNPQYEQQPKHSHAEYPYFLHSQLMYSNLGSQPINNSAFSLSGWNPSIDSYRHVRYDSPGGHHGGNLSESSSDYAVSPEVARQQITFSPPRYLSPPSEAHYSQQSWNAGSSYMVTPISTPASTQTSSIALKELEFQESADFQLESHSDDLRAQLPANAPEELELSDSIAIFPSTSRTNTIISTHGLDETDSSASTPAQDNDSDSDFDPRRKASRASMTLRQSAMRSHRRTSGSSYPTLDNSNRVHKNSGSRPVTGKDKPKPRPLPHFGSQSNTNASNKAPKSFPCTFHTFGCASTFANKNEWKRHVTSQHLQLGFYRCDLGGCNPDNTDHFSVQQPHGLGQANRGRGHSKRRSVSTTAAASPQDHETLDSDEVERIYNDFNRKDLFTQHCRRMHGPARHHLDSTTQTNIAINARLRSQGRKTTLSSKPQYTKDDDAAFEEELDTIRTRCWTQRRFAPQRSSCGFCGKLFEAQAYLGAPGDADGRAEERAWEDRMEHLGKHYERDGCVPDMENVDPELLEWGLHEGILEEVDGGGALLVGLNINQRPDLDGSDGARREGLRKRGPRRKVGSTAATTTIAPIVKIERVLKEEESSDIDAMAEDD